MSADTQNLGKPSRSSAGLLCDLVKQYSKEVVQDKSRQFDPKTNILNIFQTIFKAGFAAGIEAGRIADFTVVTSSTSGDIPTPPTPTDTSGAKRSHSCESPSADPSEVPARKRVKRPMNAFMVSDIASVAECVKRASSKLCGVEPHC